MPGLRSVKTCRRAQKSRQLRARCIVRAAITQHMIAQARRILNVVKIRRPL